jgi:hypothetical protein
MTLWIAHTFKYHEFSVTPRLALISPVRGCGKTTALSIIKALSFNASKLDSITAAVLFRIIDRARACALLDEVDNLDLLNNPALRAVITSGHHCDGAVSRYLKGEIEEFTTFAPLALAAIGKPPNPLPLPIAHRCVTIHMKRAPSTSEPLVRFDPKTYPRQKADFETVYRETFAWAQQCKLETNPPMPAELRNRPADNWRVLIAIADATSPEWGEAARAAAIELSIGQESIRLSAMRLRHSAPAAPPPRHKKGLKIPPSSPKSLREQKSYRGFWGFFFFRKCQVLPHSSLLDIQAPRSARE